MSDREELAALRRMAELEAKAGGMDFQGMQRDALRHKAMEAQIANDPLSRDAQATSQEGVWPTWMAGKPSATMPERIAATPGARFAGGAAAPFIGTAQLASRLDPTGVTKNYIDNNIQQMHDMKVAGGAPAGFDPMDFAGQVMSPMNIGLARSMGPANTAASRIGQGAAMGFVGGATAPVTDTDNYAGTKAGQVLGGTVAGAALPAAWEGSKLVGRGVRNVVQPYLGQWGADRAAGRLANLTAGDRQAQVIAELRGSQPVVPGSNPTAGQASVPANSAEFAALQKMASESAPSEYFGRTGIEGQQNAARIAALRTVGQTPQALETAINTRSSDALQNYGAAYAQQIKADPKLAVLFQNPYVKDAIPDAVKLAEANGVNPKTDLTQFLHYVKISLDKMSGRVGDTALANTERQAVQSVKGDLIGWLANKNPMYDTARSEFAKASMPINQMQIGQEVEKRLVPALSDEAKQRAATYAQALRDAPGTIKRATGQPRFDDLGQIMTPQQMQTLGNVQSDLANTAAYEDLARNGMKKARDVIGQSIPEVPPTGMFSPIISVLRGGYNRIAGKGTDKTMDDLARLMRDPKRTAEMMEAAKPYERRALVDALMKYQGAGAANAVSQGMQK